MSKGLNLTSIVLSGALALSTIGCVENHGKPTIVDNLTDYTGDGKKDMLVDVYYSNTHDMDRFLFIADSSGSYIRAKEEARLDNNYNEVKYFVTDDGKKYENNGEFYLLQKE